MIWIPLKDAISEHHLSERTIRRRIATLLKYDPVLYSNIIRRQQIEGKYISECKRREFFEYLDTDVRLFKKLNHYMSRKTERSDLEADLPSVNRMMVSLLQVSDLHMIDYELRARLKEVLYSKYNERFQKAIQVCYHYSFPEETKESACEKVGVCRKTFYIWVENFPLLHVFYANSKSLRSTRMKQERLDLAHHSLTKLVKGYDKILKTRKYKIDRLPNGDEIQIAYEMVTREKHVPPNLTAVLTQLYNLDGGEYKRNPVFEEAPDGDEFKNYTDEELLEYLNEITEHVRQLNSNME